MRRAIARANSFKVKKRNARYARALVFGDEELPRAPRAVDARKRARRSGRRRKRARRFALPAFLVYSTVGPDIAALSILFIINAVIAVVASRVRSAVVRSTLDSRLVDRRSIADNRKETDDWFVATNAYMGNGEGGG